MGYRAHAEELRRDLGVRYTYRPKSRVDGHEMIPVVVYAPLPRLYRKAVGIKTEDYLPKIKELMEKDFAEYEKETGKKAIVPQVPFPEGPKYFEWKIEKYTPIGELG